MGRGYGSEQKNININTLNACSFQEPDNNSYKAVYSIHHHDACVLQMYVDGGWFLNKCSGVVTVTTITTLSVPISELRYPPCVILTVSSAHN